MNGTTIFAVKCILLACFVWEWVRFNERGRRLDDAAILILLAISLAMLDHGPGWLP